MPKSLHGTKIELGEKAKSGSIRDPAVEAAGTAELRHISDDLDLNSDVPTAYYNIEDKEDADRVNTEDGTLGTIRELGRGNAVTKEERSEVPPTKILNPQFYAKIIWLVPHRILLISRKDTQVV